MKHLFTLILSFFTLAFANATVHNVSSIGLTYTPDAITINQGDSVIWNLTGSHDVVEVSQATYLAGGNTSNGGFSTPFGGGTVVFNTPGLFYYVCTPHASLGMIGTINVSAGPPTDLVITTEVCGATDLNTEVRLTGPFWNWDPLGGPIAVNNGDGTFTFTLSPAPGADMEYLFVLDGVQEDMVASGTASGNWSCTPVTDNANYANRQWLTTDPLALSGLVYGSCDLCPAPFSAQMDLPVTFDDTAVNYSFIDFGGNSSAFVADPANASNMVIESTKGVGGPEWSGTTLATPGNPPGALNVDTGLLNPIPFAVGATTMSVRVYSTGPGLPVRLKVERDTDVTMTCETEATTTATNAWETLVFDFSNEATGTAALNFASVYNKISIFYNFGTTGNGEVFYWDDVEFGGGTPPDPCLGVSPDPNILDDFECQGNITYSFANATWNEVVTNPNPTGINTTDRVGEFIHWGAGTDGAFGGSLDLAPIDLTNSGGQFKMDVHPSEVGLPIVFILQDSNGADLANQTALTTVAGEWETLSYDMSAALTSNDVSKIVLVVSSGDSVQHVVYFDNIRLDTVSVSPCAGITPEPSIFDDFECQGNFTYTFANATWLEDVANPNASGINTSAKVGQFIHWGDSTDGAFGGSLNLAPIDLNFYGTALTIDVHSSASGLPVTVVFQDDAGADILAQNANTTVAGQWETLSYDFSGASGPVSKVVFVVSPNDTVQHELYFDNIRLDTSTAIATCPGIAPDVDVMEDFDCQQNTTYTSTDGSLAVITNPDTTGINTSDNVGEYTRSSLSADAIVADFNLAPLDFATHNQMKLDVWDASVPSVVEITLLDAAGISLATATATTSVGNAWEQLNFDFQLVPFTASVAKATLQFDSGSSSASNKVYYYDNWKMDGVLTGIRDLNLNALSVYPNPVNEFINLDMNVLDLNSELTANIVTADGRIIQSTSIASGTRIERIDVSQLSSGMYFIELTDSKSKWMSKFVKK